jgi:hypothetical protein
MGKQGVNVKRNYLNCVYKLLFRFAKPTREDVYHHLCRSGNCPDNACTNDGGWADGRSCPHVLNVLKLIKQMLQDAKG